MQPQTRQSDVLRKVLYVEKRMSTEIGLDGAALKVTQQDKAAQLFPLIRISRMVVDTGIVIDTNALMACAYGGISICFTDPQEGVVAHLVAVNNNKLSLQQQLDDFSDRVDWRDRYADWQHAMFSRAFLHTLKKFDISTARSVSPSALTQLFQQWAGQLSGKEAAINTDRWLDQLCYAWFVQHLLEQGVECGGESEHSMRLNLAQKLGEIMRWELELYRLDWLRQRNVQAREQGKKAESVSRKAMIFWFESIVWQVDEAGSRLLNRLQQWLIEIASE